MLEECWVKVQIFCTCHPICLIEHASPFILSVNIKSKMTIDMLSPVILSELVNSDDEKPLRGKIRERIIFLNFSFFLFLLHTFFGLLAFSFSAASISFLHLRILLHFVLVNQTDGQNLLCCCSGLFRFDMYDFFYCYYFAERFSFVESFEIRSSNIQNDVMRMKCWMKQRVNQSNIKILLDAPENVG